LRKFSEKFQGGLGAMSDTPMMDYLSEEGDALMPLTSNTLPPPCSFHTPSQFLVSVTINIRTNKGAGFVSESYSGSADGLDGLAALIRIWRDLCNTVKPEVIE
jgi:hypothetical protein